nr:MAG TPA: GcrA cell cycle regulator [Caudoviricetes sp.]
MNTVMSNASGSGVPFNCQNWLALGVVIFTEIDIDEALQQIGLKTSGNQEEWREANKEKIIALRKAGLSIKAISRRLCVTAYGVKVVLRNAGYLKWV